MVRERSVEYEPVELPRGVQPARSAIRQVLCGSRSRLLPLIGDEAANRSCGNGRLWLDEAAGADGRIGSNR
jgi:hypothetical protein